MNRESDRFAVPGEDFVALDVATSLSNHQDFRNHCWDLDKDICCATIAAAKDGDMKRAWKEAKEVVFTGCLDENCVKAVYAFTVETPVPFYKKLNSNMRMALQDRSLSQLSNEVRSFAALLFRAIVTGADNICCELYRGVPNAKFNRSVGSKIHFGSFLSTSKKRWIAESFGKANGIIFIIKSNSIGLELPVSQFEGEEEVLFEPFAVFCVEKINNSGKNQEVTLVQQRDDHFALIMPEYMLGKNFYVV